MKHSDSVKAILLASIYELANEPTKYAVNPGKDFSHNRKLGFKNFLLMFLAMEADCIKEELYRYFRRNTETPSKAAFYKQRKKLREDALQNLLFTFNKKLRKNLYNGKSTRGFDQIHINAFYSILDRRFTDLVIQPGRKHNEYQAFCSMVDAADPKDPATVYFGDMGYASYNNFAHVIEREQYFLIRCNDKKARGIFDRPLDDVRELDCHVDRILSRSHSKKKPKGCFENIITNLPNLEFDIEEFKDLYHLRWNEENSIRDL